MRMSFTRSLQAAVAVCGIAIAGLAPADAADKLRIGWTTSDGPTDPYAITARTLAAELDKRLPGKFDVAMFPNNQLGDEKQMLEGLGFGTLDVGIITNAPIGNIAPAFQLNDMPFLYASEEQAHQVLDGEIGQQILTTLDGKGIVGLGFAEGGFRHMINNKRPVLEPEDVSGVKYRVMQNPVFIGMFEALGGNATPMAWGETYTATQQGTIDGLEIPLAVIAANKYAEVTKYLSLTRHTYSALGVLVSKRFFDKLSAEEQDAFRAAAAAAIASQRAETARNTAELLDVLKAAGMEINEVKDAAAFRSRVGNVYEQFKPVIGAELFDKALAAVE